MDGNGDTVGQGWGGMGSQRHAGMGLGALGHIETSLEGCGTPEQGWVYRGEWDMLGQTRGGVLGGTGHTGTGLGGVGTGLEGLGWG